MSKKGKIIGIGFGKRQWGGEKTRGKGGERGVGRPVKKTTKQRGKERSLKSGKFQKKKRGWVLKKRKVATVGKLVLGEGQGGGAMGSKGRKKKGPVDQR